MMKPIFGVLSLALLAACADQWDSTKPTPGVKPKEAPAKPGAKDPKTGVKTDTPEAKPEETKPEAKPETKPEVKPEGKPEEKADLAPNDHLKMECVAQRALVLGTNPDGTENSVKKIVSVSIDWKRQGEETFNLLAPLPANGNLADAQDGAVDIFFYRLGADWKAQLYTTIKDKDGQGQSKKTDGAAGEELKLQAQSADGKLKIDAVCKPLK